MLATEKPQGRGLLETLSVERQPIFLGTLYALGHALVVAILGLAALLLGAALPAWIDPIMGRVVGATLVFLGVYVFVSLYQYVRHGGEFRLQAVGCSSSTACGGRRMAPAPARIHGRRVAFDPIEASSYGPRTAFGVGMIHGIGAETASQALLIAAVGGASSQGLGVPMLFALIIGLVFSNTVIVVMTARPGFIASQVRTRLYVGIGVLAGIFSIWIGTLMLFQAEGSLPNLDEMFRFIGG